MLTYINSLARVGVVIKARVVTGADANGYSHTPKIQRDWNKWDIVQGDLSTCFFVPFSESLYSSHNFNEVAATSLSNKFNYF